MALFFFASLGLRRRQHWVSTEVMASSDADDNMLTKVEDTLAATAPERVVCRLCDEVIQEGRRSLSPGLFGCKTLDKSCWAALKSIQRLTQNNPDMKAKVGRCRSSDMDKFKCIGLSLRTDDNNRRSNVQRKELSSTSPRWLAS